MKVDISKIHEKQRLITGLPSPKTLGEVNAMIVSVIEKNISEKTDTIVTVNAAFGLWKYSAEDITNEYHCPVNGVLNHRRYRNYPRFYAGYRGFIDIFFSNPPASLPRSVFGYTLCHLRSSPNVLQNNELRIPGIIFMDDWPVLTEWQREVDTVNKLLEKPPTNFTCRIGGNDHYNETGEFDEYIPMGG